MRQRLQGFLPILLIALMVQILAPIGATLMTAIAIADPLGAVEICHSGTGRPSPQDDRSGHAHDACTTCCAAQAASLDTPQPARLEAPYRQASVVVWRTNPLTLAASRTGSNTQARAPPLSM